MANFLQNFFGTKSQRDIKEILPYIKKIKEIYPNIQQLNHDELRQKTIGFKEKIQEAVATIDQQIASLREQMTLDAEMLPEEKENIYNQIDKLDKARYDQVQVTLNEILPEAFAVIKSTAERFTNNEIIEVTANNFDRDLAAKSQFVTIEGDKAIFQTTWLAGGNLTRWDMIHYEVQLIGGVVLHQGKIAEMATGEGKTLVATLPVYLNALSGDGVHIVTVNDYLAKRDSEWMGMIYQFHGLSVDCIDKHQPNSEARRKAYNSDITFGTNNEFGFDYLRDNMTGDPNELVQRKHNFAIVDEVDSVLIDDARTPLIISGPTPKGEQQEFDQYKPIVEKLYNNQKTLVTKLLAESKQILTNNPTSEQEKKGGELLLRAYRGLPKNKALIKFLSEPGIRTLLQKTENFYLAEQGKHMHIIDEDLYFVIDEKANSIDPTEKGIELMNTMVNDEAFYYIPDVGAEIAILEKSDLSEEDRNQKKNELLNEFALKSERVHTVNQLLKAYTLFEKDVEYVIIENKIKIVDEQTGRIMEGRRYSDGLHQAIEAKENVKVEAATQTYATITLQNYFRMYSKLSGMTGTAETEAGEFWDIYKLDVVVIPTNRPIARDDREDLVYKTKREKFNAVIDEIENLVKQKRPVLVGTTSVETSELLSRMLQRKQIDHNVLNAKLHAREADIVRDAGQPGVVTIATNMAGRGTDIKLGKGVKESGGLAIIGTERHDSRRVDRQLRGRAGRQGDPGSSQFYVSLEDDLMRMFGSERIAKVMDRLGLKEGEEIQHSMITSSIERAQKKVEENNFGIRKRLLEYDDVMNSQRDVIYKKRRHALFGERLSVDLANMIYDTLETIIAEYQDLRDPAGFRLELLTTLNADIRIDDKEFMGTQSTELTDKLFKTIYANYRNKQEMIAERAYPIIKNVVENHSHYENIAIPITDGRRTRNVVANLKKSYEFPKTEIPLAIEKSITLGYIDDAWKDHLRELDELKQSVQNASYEQKDPLLIYKFESFELFKNMIQKVNKNVASFLIKGNLPMADPSVKEAQRPKSLDKQQLKTQRNDLLSQSHSNTQQKEKTQPITVGKKIGRNDPCPCGSGKKYKNCHGREGAEPLN
ncbi:MAG: preprotein translocase subunit SecA [Bacteroidales bacterium]|nr:preprotein translocase subunit SecA [Bacteroidales bacterium]MDD3010006.1 preprotein translocase subunit SecA [Bacteroidales bacterium]MDD3960967.1 preprotein translocase subunit SecA [Bacteroidales bacterium]MDY0285712.1 preprotein translocase subunit SecA [Bacteroidales bacterium]